MYDSIGTTTYCMIICMKSRLMSFSYDSVTEGCISVKCQLLTVNFVGFGCQPGFRLHTSRQSFEPSYTRIQALLVFFLSFALASQPLWVMNYWIIMNCDDIVIMPGRWWRRTRWDRWPRQPRERPRSRLAWGGFGQCLLWSPQDHLDAIFVLQILVT